MMGILLTKHIKQSGLFFENDTVLEIVLGQTSPNFLMNSHTYSHMT